MRIFHPRKLRLFYNEEYLRKFIVNFTGDVKIIAELDGLGSPQVREEKRKESKES
jgi:hypothetical protein